MKYEKLHQHYTIDIQERERERKREGEEGSTKYESEIISF